MTNLVVESLEGICPVQGYGSIDGVPFYFRARGSRWTFSVGADPLSSSAWQYAEPYGDVPFAAGWMEIDEARGFIEKAAGIFRKHHTSEADTAYAAHAAAEQAWEAELDRVFGKRAGDARYYAEGRGEPGSALRTLAEARDATLAAWEQEKAKIKPLS